ncbi:MAG: L-2-amino-thiazoline-4-carboxylic acid hydrolase [Clostridiales Family XIII bacterium]|nr:L-2-amino-thiazoline-4-carboxylic acid hydrolase [Clostridiales Family XIII bacterium]
MNKTPNIPTIDEDKININRAQIEHRATWMGLIFDELNKAGIDAEPILRRAIHRCGNMHGENFKAMCEDPSDAASFAEAFFNEVGMKTFEMDNKAASKTETGVDFHYCPLLNAWRKLGFDDERCDLLCDIAMEGDRGIAETMGLELDLKQTIAGGSDICKLLFHKKEGR